MRYINILVSLVIGFLLSACGGGGGNPGTNTCCSASGTSPIALFTTAPETLTLAPGAALEFSIGGGTAPYTAVSDNSAIAVAGINSSSLTLGGVAPGTAGITVRDSAGASVKVALIVSNGPAKDLYTTAPPNITVAIGNAWAQTYTIGGGAGPYTATSSNTLVATVALSGNSFTVNGVLTGTTNVVVRDSAGATLNVAVSVAPSSSLPLYTTAPPSLTLAIGPAGADQPYRVGGGTGPYTATSGNSNVVAVTLLGDSLTVTGLTAGSANVFVRDSVGTIVTVACTVVGGQSVPLFTTAPPSVTVAVGSTTTYGFGGGVGPYTATSNNTSIATVSLAGSSLTVIGVNAGSANIVLRDSAGTTVNVAVTVSAASTVALFTTAPSAVTMAANQTRSYGVGGGTGPYTATSANTGVVTVALAGNSMTVTSVKAGSANVVLRDAAGESVSVAFTVALPPLSVTPNNATGIIDDVLLATIVGGTPPYRASVGNILVASASIVGLDGLSIKLKQTGQTVITVLDANNQSAPYSVTSNAATPGIRLSPSAITVSERDSQAIILSVYGATGAVSVFSSDVALLRAAVTGGKVNVTTGTNGNRCVNQNTGVTITVVDATGASAVATVTITDNGTCP